MKSKIKKIESKNPYSNAHGTVIYHNLEMENGDKINIGKKKEQQEGWELNYEIVETGQQEYNKAKSVQEENISYATSNVPNTNKQSYQKEDVKDDILYQSTMKEVMAYFVTYGFGLVDAKKVETIQGQMDIISDTCFYLAKKSKENIIKLKEK